MGGLLQDGKTLRHENSNQWEDEKEQRSPHGRSSGAGDTAIIETIDLCFPRYDQLQWNNDISVLFWPIHSKGNLFCVTGGLQGTTQLMCARDQREQGSQLENEIQRKVVALYSGLFQDVTPKWFSSKFPSYV